MSVESGENRDDWNGVPHEVGELWNQLHHHAAEAVEVLDRANRTPFDAAREMGQGLLGGVGELLKHGERVEKARLEGRIEGRQDVIRVLNAFIEGQQVDKESLKGLVSDGLSRKILELIYRYR